MLNTVIVMGRLTRDPELRRTTQGTPVTSFTIAVDRDYAKGERETDFIDIVAWRSTAEFVSSYFAKGRTVIVRGSLQTRKWTDKSGNERRNLEIVAENVYFGDSKREGTTAKFTDNAYTAPVQFSEYDDAEDDFDDMPF